MAGVSKENQHSAGRFQDLTGKKFGRLLVLSFEKRITYGNGRNMYSMWNCKCDCGNDFVGNGHSMKKGTTKSCGCLNIENINKRNENREEVLISEVFSRYKHGAKKRNLSFKLSLEQFTRMIFQPCFYCNDPPSNILKDIEYQKDVGQIIRSDTILKYNGLDRVNNEFGYEYMNVFPCCYQCNWMKQDLTLEAFFEKLIKIHNNVVS